MRLLILSDLHREQWKQYGATIDLAISRPDCVILAGDIDVGVRAVAWAAKVFAGLPVMYVSGNHELYGYGLENIQTRIEEACRATQNVHYLNCAEFHSGNVRFLDATLWADFCLFGDAMRFPCKREAEKSLADYRCIQLAVGRKLRASDTERFHAEQAAWLTQILAQPHDGPTVVITHMAPSLRSVHDKYAKDWVSAAFASQLDHLVMEVDMWIHGHVHDSFDYRVGNCRVVCNPRGYMTKGGTPENRAFDPNRIVII